MTEEIEQKLNELLGMKKQLEEFTTEKKKSEAVGLFTEKKKKLKIWFWIFMAVTIAIMFGGLTGIETSSGSKQLTALFIALVGYEGTVLMKLWYHTTQSRLLILEEMKQFELRITEMLGKQAGTK